MSEIDIDKLSFLEAMEALKRSLKNRYPDCGMIYFAYQPVVGDHARQMMLSGGFGDLKTVETCGTEIVLRDKTAESFVHDVFMNYILSIGSNEFKTRELMRLHDCVLDYAHSRGIDTQGYEKILKDESIQVEPKKTRSVEYNSIEGIAAKIKMLQDEIASLQREIDPRNMAAVLKAVAKRMRRAGDIEGAKAKDLEADEILKKLERKIELKRTRIELLKIAREAKALNTKKREQAERDRQKSQQFNPHAAAKAKRQKIRERQAERKASKKKASESKEWSNRPIGQVIASRIF